MIAHGAAVAAVLGAWLSEPVWTPVVFVAVVLAARRRGFVVVALAAGLLASTAGDHALDGLDPPESGPFDAWVTVVDDPRPIGRGVRATVRHAERLFTVTAHSVAGGRLDDVAAGEQVHLTGSVRPVSADDSWSRWNHVVGRVTVDTVVDVGSGSPVARLANAVRRVLARGVERLSRDDRALFLGMVIGDDREQSPVIADDFRAAGLGHLLVVSGQNVAFVLALASPIAIRLRPGTRLLALLAVLLLFSFLTRFEPSVLRAVAMAGVGVGGTALGFPVDGRKALAWAVAALVVIDPFLVHVVAFQLSVAATAGIVWLSPTLASRVPGPRGLAVAFATTASAQLAVAPLLLTTFGPVPIASLPANLLAGPASGPVMMWGATAGFVAGIFGGPLATIVHLPTEALLWWVGSVAAFAGESPPAAVAGPGLIALAVAAGCALHQAAVMRGIGALIVVAVFIRSVIGVDGLPDGRSGLGDGLIAVRHEDVTVLVLDDPGRPRDILETARLASVGRPDLIVALDGDAADAEAVVALVDRFGPLAVLAPPLHRVPGARTAHVGQRIVWNGTRVEIIAVDPELEVIVR